MINLTTKTRVNYDDYGGPLGYYFSSPELHALTRSQLFSEDRRLYLELSKKDQLKKAIPESYRGRTSGPVKSHKDSIEKILNSFESCEGGLTRAEQETNHSKSTIARYWRRYGLEPITIGQRKNLHREVNEDERQKVLDYYNKNKGPTMISFVLSMPILDVLKVLREEGLKLKPVNF